MKIRTIQIHNYRSILDATLLTTDYLLLIGSNNAGKSTILNALRAFYEDSKWTSDDFPKIATEDQESWVELIFLLDDEEWEGLADKYKLDNAKNQLTVRRLFKSDQKGKVQTGQSNIYGVINGQLDNDLFYGAKNVGAAKVGQIVYIPALTTTAEQTKMSGPSPLRNMLNFLLRKVVAKSKAYQEVTTAFEKLNEEAKQQDGFLSEISTPLNNALSSWQIQIDLSVNSVSPEDISKNLIRYAFIDAAIGAGGFELDRYGHGFQRSVIYELIRLAPSFKEEKKADKKEFNPSFSLILFEEPEAFLHPSQQEVMAYHLRRLAKEPEQQVIITTHSPIFVGKAAEDLSQLVRVRRTDGLSEVFQPSERQIAEMFEQGGELLQALQAFVADPGVGDDKKKNAKRMIENPPTGDIALQEEQFRFQLWLDGERSSMFFADKVLLVEGATERGLFNYLLANDWHDLSGQRIFVVDVLGKYNFHRYMALMKAYGIQHGVILDDDNNKEHHEAVNDLIEASVNVCSVAAPEKFAGCLETFLGLPVPACDRKPLEMLKAVAGRHISAANLSSLRERFCRALAIT